MDPRLIRRTARDAMWVIAGAFIAFPVVAMVILGFNAAYLFLMLIGVAFFFVGLFANLTGLA
jgi:hypothetical protein